MAWWGYLVQHKEMSHKYGLLYITTEPKIQKKVCDRHSYPDSRNLSYLVYASTDFLCRSHLSTCLSDHPSCVAVDLISVPMGFMPNLLNTFSRTGFGVKVCLLHIKPKEFASGSNIYG
ncbi:unnamed protein product [Meganyctiphanes norvegica]|uniref:Uncharacterized protein n=1 Tax=Meganyctiphanes norvegica TaxID=48144 RepID=A0AAV2S3L9_MEGNR